MRRVLVAGATGYLGGFVAREFKARDYLVRALARSLKKLDPLRGSLDEIVQAEVTRPETLDKVCDGIDVGGPEVLTHRQIAELAFSSVGKQPLISSVPLWAMKATVSLTKTFNRHQGELLAFLTTAMSSDAVAPAVGVHRLEGHFRGLASSAHTKKKEQQRC